MKYFNIRNNYIFYINLSEFIVFKFYDIMEKLRSLRTISIKYLNCDSLKLLLNKKLLEELDSTKNHPLNFVKPERIKI